MTPRKDNEFLLFNSDEEMPERNIRKGSILWTLPDVVKLKAAVAGGLKHGALVRLSSDRMAHLKISTPGRILKEMLVTWIAKEELKAKDGSALTVERYKSLGDEIVSVKAGEPAPKRITSDVRTRIRRGGGR